MILIIMNILSIWRISEDLEDLKISADFGDFEHSGEF